MVHARISAKKFGGVPEDYLKIHDWFDQTKMALPDVRHRMILHNSVGCYIAEQVFGHTLTNSEGKTVHVRDVAEAHVIEDLGFIPTLEKCLSGMQIEPWMSGGVHRYKEESKPQYVEAKAVEGSPNISSNAGEQAVKETLEERMTKNGVSFPVDRNGPWAFQP